MSRDLKIPDNVLGQITKFRRAIERADDLDEVLKLGGALDGIESMMRKAGLYSTEKIRPANEGKFEARWKLGRVLKKMERGSGPGRGKKVSRAGTSFRSLLKDKGIAKNRANEAEHIGAMPREVLQEAFADAVKADVLNTVEGLLLIARPYWHQEKRKATHRRIVSEAEAAQAADRFGPFPLIYADPPWVFETHTPDMTHRMPDDHYPTLTDQEIIDVRFFGRSIPEIATDDTALFMWCTSSNVERALAVLRGWGFVYKTHAIWDKEQIGLGLIFRNQHEVLLYGSRGNPPKPLFLPSSVFRYPRTAHSAKPPQIRTVLEQMYPMFDARTRVELFSRDQVEGWTHVGYEANHNAAGKVA